MAKISSASPSREILEAALQALESQREKLDGQISEVRRLLGVRGAAVKKATTKSESSSNSGRSASRKKRALSAEARARIAAAQKKRWAAFRRSQS
jgi:peptidoglycan hydrolase CwlO-like protein